jgi:repressor LexA
MWSRPPLTSRQLQLLRAIAADIRTYGVAPTIAELEQAFNLSAGTIHGHLAMLEWKRYIRREPYRERAITLIEPVP